MRKLITEWQTLPDLRVAYTQAGTGKTLLLLHGNSENKSLFKQYQQEYFSEFNTLALDSRAHGQSRSKDTALTYEQLADDVIAFCQVRQITEASVIGYSDGGITGLWLAVKSPKVFTRVVTIAPNTVANANTPGFVRFVEKSMRTMQILLKFGVPLKKALMRFALMLTDSGIGDDDLRAIRSKVMLLYAEKDMITEEHLLHIGGLIPGCVTQKVMGCTHMTIPHQQESIRLMRDFLLN